MSYQIKYYQTAENDLIEITLYYLNQTGLSKAQEILNKIQSQINNLSFCPERCQAYLPLPQYRQLVIQRLPYKAYFIIDEPNKIVYIVHILHTSRNHLSLLN